MTINITVDILEFVFLIIPWIVTIGWLSARVLGIHLGRWRAALVARADVAATIGSPRGGPATRAHPLTAVVHTLPEHAEAIAGQLRGGRLTLRTTAEPSVSSHQIPRTDHRQTAGVEPRPSGPVRGDPRCASRTVDSAVRVENRVPTIVGRDHQITGDVTSGPVPGLP